MKTSIKKIEFYVDANGGIFAHLWDCLTGHERNVTWLDLISRKDEMQDLHDMYTYISYNHPHITERIKLQENIDNVSNVEKFKFLRRFISYFLADDCEKDYDFIRFTDQTVIVNLESYNCAINCPSLHNVLKNIQGEIDGGRQSDCHKNKVIIEQNKRLIKG